MPTLSRTTLIAALMLAGGALGGSPTQAHHDADDLAHIEYGRTGPVGGGSSARLSGQVVSHDGCLAVKDPGGALTFPQFTHQGNQARALRVGDTVSLDGGYQDKPLPGAAIPPQCESAPGPYFVVTEL